MRRLVPVRTAGRATEHQEPESLCPGPGRDARLADRLHLHWKRAPAQWGCAGGSRRRADRHPRCWRWARRGLPRASRGARPATRRLFPYRPGRPVRGVRLRAGPEDSEVAVGDAAANPVLTESCRSVAAVGDSLERAHKAVNRSSGLALTWNCERLKWLLAGKPYGRNWVRTSDPRLQGG